MRRGNAPWGPARARERARGDRALDNDRWFGVPACVAAPGSRRFIAVAGNIGVGKSTLVGFLARSYNLTPRYEPNEGNPYLKDFYGDMRRWSFHSQVYFLAKKFRIHQELSEADERVIQDRTIYEDAEIFAENLFRRRQMSKRDYQTYRDLYESIVRQLRPPDLMIYLTCSMRTVRKRIKMRGRPEEQAIPIGYLRRLQQLYDGWFERYDRSETVVIETDKLDYIQDLVHRIDLHRRVEKVLR